jgi:bifunctional non-homologous end joining protein LigD
MTRAALASSVGVPVDNPAAHRATEAGIQPPPAVPTARAIAITTPQRPVYPALGFTKLALARLYAELADRMLPYIANRPLTLVR